MRARTVWLSLLLMATPACGDDDGGSIDAGDGDGTPDAGADAAAACDQTVVGTICTIAGNGEAGWSGDDGPALAATMSLPTDTLKVGDILYILDWNNHRIRRLMPGGTIEHVAGRGELGGGLDEPANSDFNHLTQIMLNGEGDRLIVAAWHNSKIREVDLASGEIFDTAGDGRRAYFGDEGPALTAALDLPASIVFDPDGNLVIMDQANQVIRMIDSAGLIHRIAGNCILDAAPPAGPGPCDAPVQCPGGSGKMTCGDPVTTCGGACNPGYAGGTATEMRMSQPFGQSADPAGRMVYDADGNLLFADTDNSLIRKLDPEGNVTIVAGLPPVDGVAQKGYSGDGGPATEALLNRPVDLEIGGDDTLYFTDVFNHCIRAIGTDGVINTVVGTCGERGSGGDGGPATAAKLTFPYGVEYADGVLYVADSGNYTIRSVQLDE